MVFIILSNYFNVLFPQISSFIINYVQQLLHPLEGSSKLIKQDAVSRYLQQFFIAKGSSVTTVLLFCILILIVLAILRAFFMFLMRQTIIVMSRYIEYDQKNEIYAHYQLLDAGFYKQHTIGDLMNRLAEDVSKVRMFTGPAMMYIINLIAAISLSLFFMLKRDVTLTLYVMAPVPLLAILIYNINTYIHRQSEKNQAILSDLTTNAQESYSGIRIIKSFVQEQNMFQYFDNQATQYRTNALKLARVEALYFPSITFLIGLSTLLTIMISGLYYINGHEEIGLSTIVEFVLYINMLTFPVSAIGLTASMLQRASASQKRINEFLNTKPFIKDEGKQELQQDSGGIVFKNVSFTYANTGITASTSLNLKINKGEKVAIMGRTGSGKTTLAHLLLRFYDPGQGVIELDGKPLHSYRLPSLRKAISYVPQDVFLFSDTVLQNIDFTAQSHSRQQVEQAAKMAVIHNEIMELENGYDTVVGERGVTLSGGQKQRISIARVFSKPASIYIFDDCLSAVDATTEKKIAQNMDSLLHGKTAIVITHRIITSIPFTRIIILEDGAVIEQGTHNELMAANGYYAAQYRLQQSAK